MPKHKRGIIPNQYSLVHSTNISSEQSTPAESKETLNILNGVLNCAWNKTSAIPKLLEIANTSEVKFNIDSDNPLVVAFANGWDDLDRPAQIVKRLAAAPTNIDLSAKANCHVQICAKVINDELVITTHDIYDPNVFVYENMVPTFSDYTGGDAATVTHKGWTISQSSYKVSESKGAAWRLFNREANKATTYDYGWQSTNGRPQYVYVTAPFSTILAGYKQWFANVPLNSHIDYYDTDLSSWVQLSSGVNVPAATVSSFIPVPVAPKTCTQFRIYFYRTDATYAMVLAELDLYEAPTAKFFRSLNKVKDRTDTECYWINLGYATVDANGAITALNHYTDLRNNYPGGMRVEA